MEKLAPRVKRSLVQGPQPEADSWDLNPGLRTHSACSASFLPTQGESELTRRTTAAAGMTCKEVVRQSRDTLAVELLQQDGAGFSLGFPTQLCDLVLSLAQSLSFLIFEVGITPISEAYMRSRMCVCEMPGTELCLVNRPYPLVTGTAC